MPERISFRSAVPQNESAQGRCLNRGMSPAVTSDDGDMSSEVTESDICQKCGLCCKGTLYAMVAVTPDEANALGDVPNFIINPMGGLSMSLGCKLLSEAGSCSVYEKRPKACVDFACKLLLQVRAGHWTPEEALLMVETIYEQKRDLQRTCQEFFSDQDWPLLLVGRGELKKRINEEKQKETGVTVGQETLLLAKMRSIVASIRMFIEPKFLSKLKL